MKKSNLYQLMFCIPFIFLHAEQQLFAQTFPSMVFDEEYAMLDIHFSDGNSDSSMTTNQPTDPEIKLSPAFELEKILMGSSILFNYRDHGLTPASMIILDKVAELIKKNPTAIFKVTAHTDARGDANDNMRLSMDRAQSTVYYLLSKGVDSDQLIAEGQGENKLLTICGEGSPCTETDHALNRRVEIRLVTIYQ